MTIHFIGIGGIGVSALAKYYLAKGHKVTGSDLAQSEITNALKKLGAKIFIGKPDPTHVPKDVEMIIYSPAVQKDNPELQKAYEIRDVLRLHSSPRGSRLSRAGQARYPSTSLLSKRVEALESRAGKIQVLSYPEALGALTKTHHTIAISGTHGKSTTTSMIALVLVKAGFDPTVIVGTKLKEFGKKSPRESNGSNCRVGEGKYLKSGKPILVIEADEHFASFLNYWPQVIVLTTIERDHLDYYKNLGNIIKTFRRYVTHVPRDGLLIANRHDPNTLKILARKNNLFGAVAPKVLWYSLKQKETKNIRMILKVPGEHNVANALAALATARALGIPDTTSYKALSEFKGTWRRFEIFKLKKPVPYTLVSDYGHHPTKARVTVEAARSKWPKRKIWLVYQPHQYARTYYLFKDFVKVLARVPVDKLIITDIFDVAGREDPTLKAKVSSAKLVQKILNTIYYIPDTILYIPTLSEAEQYLKKNLRGREIVMVMGAGDVYQLTVRLCSAGT